MRVAKFYLSTKCTRSIVRMDFFSYPYSVNIIVENVIGLISLSLTLSHTHTHACIHSSRWRFVGELKLPLTEYYYV